MFLTLAVRLISGLEGIFVQTFLFGFCATLCICLGDRVAGGHASELMGWWNATLVQHYWAEYKTQTCWNFWQLQNFQGAWKGSLTKWKRQWIGTHMCECIGDVFVCLSGKENCFYVQHVKEPTDEGGLDCHTSCWQQSCWLHHYLDKQNLLVSKNSIQIDLACCMLHQHQNQTIRITRHEYLVLFGCEKPYFRSQPTIYVQVLKVDLYSCAIRAKGQIF